MSKKFRIVFVSVCLIASCLSTITVKASTPPDSSVSITDIVKSDTDTTKSGNAQVKKVVKSNIKPDVFSRPATCTDWSASSGSGNEASPYLINTKTDLYCMADLVNAGVSGFTNNVWSLTGDIYLDSTTDGNWLPIGTSAKRFSGSLYGGGFTLSGIHIDNTSDYQGLIGYANTIKTISDIGIKNSYIKGKSYVRGLVGYVFNTLSTLSNSYNQSDISGTGSVGGLVGYVYGPITTLSNSYNQSDISGTGSVGGLVGYVMNTFNTLLIPTTKVIFRVVLLSVV